MTDMQALAFELHSPDGHTIHGTRWIGEGNIIGVIQLFHGLGEHHLRYERFARAATAQDLVVVAHDHRGHGADCEELGYFADKEGWQRLIDDGLLVTDMIREQHEGAPIALLGHSMGSYIAQYFAMLHGDRLAGLILSASTWPQKVQLIPGRVLARLEAWRIGAHGKSRLLDKLGIGDFNKPFEPARTEFDWLSRDEDEVDAYVADSLCGGPYTCGLWLDLMGGLMKIGSDKALQRIRSDLPLLLTGGADDPVGGDRGITKLAMHYAQSGHGRLSVKIYANARHEMFNETNRDEFTAYVLNWVSQLLPFDSRT